MHMYMCIGMYASCIYQYTIFVTYRQSLEAIGSMEVASSVLDEFLLSAFSLGCNGLFPPIPDSVGGEGDHS